MSTATTSLTHAGCETWQDSRVLAQTRMHSILEASLTSQELRVRRGTVIDAEPIARLFEAVYSESSHPCKDASFVRESFGRGTDLWFVGLRGDRIVACTAQSRQPWNGTYETCRSVTLPECRGSGLGSILYKRALELASRQDDFAFCFGYPRTLSMLRILRDTEIPFVILGHDGAMNIANGKREYHLVGMTGNRRRAITRVLPLGNRIATSKFVQDRIVAPLGLRSEVGAYPSACVVGPEAGERLTLGGVTFEYRFQAEMPSKALEILRMDAERAGMEEAAQALSKFLATFPTALHVSAAVLVDKIPLMKAMLKLGFEVTAYLPAYHLLARKRYDAVLLVKRSYEEEPVTHRTADLVETFRAGLAYLVSAWHPASPGQGHGRAQGPLLDSHLDSQETRRVARSPCGSAFGRTSVPTPELT